MDTIRQVQYEEPNNRPQGQRQRSGWINEDDTRSRARLEGRGWTIVALRDNPVEAQTPPLMNLDEQAVALPTTRVETAEQGEAVPGEAVPLADIEGLTGAQRDALVAAGYSTSQALRDASDDDLSAISGIGMATVRNIRRTQRGG